MDILAQSLSPHDRFLQIKSRIAQILCVCFAVLIVTLLLLVTGYLLVLGFGSLSLDFFTKLPSGELTGDVGGMRHAIKGTLVLILMAGTIGVPMGIGVGVYLSEYEAGGWLAGPTRFVCDVLAGVPSIVVGILGYELLVRPIGSANAWAGAAALAFMMVPIIARTTEEMLRLVPNSYREAAIGLGATKAQTIVQIIIPAAIGPLVTGIMLAIARIAGETAPLLFTALGSRFDPVRVDGTFPYLHVETNYGFPSLTVQIFNYATAPSADQNRLAWAGILVLICLIFVLNLAIRFMASRQTSRK